MDYEYVAVAERAVQHTAVRSMLTGQGWEEHLRVPWHGGGLSRPVWIMRRPKDEESTGYVIKSNQGNMWLEKEETTVDEPRMWTEKEILELFGPWCERFYAGPDKELVQSIAEDAQTEADMQTAYRKELQKRNERLQAGVDGQYGTIVELTRRVAKLQAAIDEVYAASKSPDVRGLKEMTLRAVRRCLRPLATKEETNG